MIARAIAVGIICAPFISAALLGLGRAARALHTAARKSQPMTNSRRDSRICLALTLLSTAAGIYFAARPSWLCVISFYAAALLGWVTARLNADHHRQLADHERARRAALLDSEALANLPMPCCSFWVHSEGEVHGPDCTRPAAAR